jgi:hypothetical protein
MWPWIKPWRDWAMPNLWPFSRSAAQPRALHYSYERAGLDLPDQPIPWNAEGVRVEALVRLPPSIGRRKGDFSLRVLGGEMVPAEHLRRAEDQGDDLYRVTFRLPPPKAALMVEVLFRDRILGQVRLPFLTREEFLEGLRLELPTLFVRLGEESVACKTFVSSQCRGLIATAILSSPTSLAPILDLDLQVEFRSEREGTVFRVPACLSCSQLTGRTALLSVVPPRHPKRMGMWTVTWLVGDRELARQRIRGISQRQFQRSLRISDSRFVVQKDKGEFHSTLQPPALEAGTRIGPCFLVASSEPGMAGLCRLHISAQVSGAIQPPLLLEQRVRISDGPTMVVPGTLDAADLEQVSGFEVRVSGRSLGVLSLCPVPEATFTGEGGFKPPSDYTWSAAAEEEMNERLGRLLEGP